MKKEIINPFLDGTCFFCGINNKLGLKLRFYWDEEKKEASAEYLPARHFAGQGNILHGAIQMGLLDEIMGWTSYAFTEKMAVTSDINVKFLRPTYINGEKIGITCRVTSKQDPKIKMHAKLFNMKGDVCTTAEGIYHVLSSEKYKDMTSTIKIVPFENTHAAAFKQLNLEWLEAYELLEPADLKYLDNPLSNILEQGGKILMAITDDAVIGSCAIIIETSNTAELAKLAVSPDAQGNGVGRMLAWESIKEARKMGVKKIFLVSNKKLNKAIQLYESFGFKHMPVPKDTIYKTADVYMELQLN